MSPKAPGRINIFIHVGRGRKWVAEIGQLCCRAFAKHAFASPLGDSPKSFMRCLSGAAQFRERNVLSIYYLPRTSLDLLPICPRDIFLGLHLNTDRRAGDAPIPVVSIVSYCYYA